MKTGALLRGPVARADVRGRATGNGRRAAEYERALSRVSLGKPGRCPDRPGVFIFVADDSGSVCGGNDPLGRRYDEIAYAIRKVSARCTCHQDLVSIVHFDVPTNADVPATPLDRKHLGTVLTGLQVPANAAISNLGPALDVAYRVASQHPNHDAVLIVTTDFELFDPDVDNIMTRLVGFPGRVHAMVLNTEPLPMLSAHPNVTVSQVDVRSAIGTPARSVFTTLTANRPGAMPATTSDESSRPSRPVTSHT